MQRRQLVIDECRFRHARHRLHDLDDLRFRNIAILHAGIFLPPLIQCIQHRVTGAHRQHVHQGIGGKCDIARVDRTMIETGTPHHRADQQQQRRQQQCNRDGNARHRTFGRCKPAPCLANHQRQHHCRHENRQLVPCPQHRKHFLRIFQVFDKQDIRPQIVFQDERRCRQLHEYDKCKTCHEIDAQHAVPDRPHFPVCRHQWRQQQRQREQQPLQYQVEPQALQQDEPHAIHRLHTFMQPGHQHHARYAGDHETGQQVPQYRLQQWDQCMSCETFNHFLYPGLPEKVADSSRIGYL